MSKEVAALARLIEAFQQLPGVGRKNAQRLAYHILSLPEDNVRKIANALLDAKTKIKRCAVCQNFCEGDTCPVCADDKRDASMICVVESAKDVQSLERMQDYHGLYHGVGGLMSPIDGVGPEQLAIHSLLERISKTPPSEVILALSPTVEGQATAMYVAALLRPLSVKVSQLAFGIPMGSSLEFTDEETLHQAMIRRQEMQ